VNGTERYESSDTCHDEIIFQEMFTTPQPPTLGPFRIISQKQIKMSNQKQIKMSNQKQIKMSNQKQIKMSN
jgi:hypothetical protein